MAYDHLTKSTNIVPGLSDFLFGIYSEFTSLGKPVAPFANPGDSLRISDAHVPAAGKGFYRAYQVPKKHTGKGDPVGSSGAKTLNNEYDIFIPGFDAVNLEFGVNIMNEEVITLHRDANCAADTWIQLGDDCLRAEIEINYTLGTVGPEGEKGLFGKVRWVGTPKFYEATVPYAP